MCLGVRVRMAGTIGTIGRVCHGVGELQKQLNVEGCLMKESDMLLEGEWHGW